MSDSIVELAAHRTAASHRLLDCSIEPGLISNGVIEVVALQHHRTREVDTYLRDYVPFGSRTPVAHWQYVTWHYIHAAGLAAVPLVAHQCLTVVAAKEDHIQSVCPHDITLLPVVTFEIFACSRHAQWIIRNAGVPPA
ncbi:hypothetical protein A0H81_13867 [Grifola frondosa]|uniref:Uncharacterized protein n=1 Tax=Grifola frondosa TaxID=5627 RepID=A0A1C7LQB4_GRIFR|nr:hypothetical protein A0H81_13867 [Grifola frondosa]